MTGGGVAPPVPGPVPAMIAANASLEPGAAGAAAVPSTRDSSTSTPEIGVLPPAWTTTPSMDAVATASWEWKRVAIIRNSPRDTREMARLKFICISTSQIDEVFRLPVPLFANFFLTVLAKEYLRL